MISERADRLIDDLLAQRKAGTEIDKDTVLHDLTLRGWRPTEIGWVLRHVFGLEMPDAVHRAVVEGRRIQQCDD